MNLDEALIIAQRIEDDDVVGPVGMALRVLLQEYKAATKSKNALEYDAFGYPIYIRLASERQRKQGDV